jgi:hypothetical protein
MDGSGMIGLVAWIWFGIQFLIKLIKDVFKVSSCAIFVTWQH